MESFADKVNSQSRKHFFAKRSDLDVWEGFACVLENFFLFQASYLEPFALGGGGSKSGIPSKASITPGKTISFWNGQFVSENTDTKCLF